MSTLFATFLTHSLKASGVIVVVLLIQKLFGPRLPARFAYALWALVLLRLLIPSPPTSSYSLFRFPSPLAGLATPDAEPTRPSVESKANDSAMKAAPSLWQRTWGGRGDILAFLWWIGFGSLAARQIVLELRLARRTATSRPVTDQRLLTLYDRARQRLGVRGRPPLHVCPQISSPALHGLWQPRILLPLTAVEDFDEEAIEHALMHELAHYRQGDHLTQALAVALLHLHWFNPLVHLASRRMQSDRESACDALVLGHLTPAARNAYGKTLVRLSTSPRGEWSGSLMGMAETYRSLRRRVSMIANFKPSSFRTTAAACGALLLLALTTLTDRAAMASDGRQDDLEAQELTLTGLRLIGSSMYRWGQDRTIPEESPVKNGDSFSWKACPTVSWAEAEAVLVPHYLPRLPRVDGWGHPLEFAMNLDAPGKAPCWIGVRSPGSDGRFDTTPYEIAGFEAKRWNHDLVWIDGFFATWPDRR